MKKHMLDVSSDLMKNTVPTENVINELNEIIINLSNTEDEKYKKKCIDEFYSKTDSWQIVSLQRGDRNLWMQTPMEYYEVNREIGFLERLDIFLKRGVWVKPSVLEKYADVASNTNVPMQVILDPLNSFFAKRSNEDKFYYSVNHLVAKILEIIEVSDASNVAIYEKPYGITAMNTVNYWMNQLQKETMVDTRQLRESLKVVSFSDLIKTSLIETEMSKEAIAEHLEKIKGKRSQVQA